jgi:hypothetical protein
MFVTFAWLGENQDHLAFEEHVEPPRVSRKQIYGTLKELNPGKDTTSWSLVDIFNRRSFWKKGVFR